MSYMTTLFQVVLLFGALGYGAYYMTKKTRKQQFFRRGEKGHIQEKEGVFLILKRGAFFFEVDGKQVFTVISNNGVQSVQLTGTGNQFQQALEDAVKTETKKVEDPS